MTIDAETLFRATIDNTPAVKAMVEVERGIDSMASKAEASSESAAASAERIGEGYQSALSSVSMVSDAVAALGQAAAGVDLAAPVDDLAGAMEGATASAKGAEGSFDDVAEAAAKLGESAVGAQLAEQLEEAKAAATDITGSMHALAAEIDKEAGATEAQEVAVKSLVATARAAQREFPELFKTGGISAADMAREVGALEVEIKRLGEAAAGTEEPLTAGASFAEQFRGGISGLAGELVGASETGKGFSAVLSGAVGGAVAGGFMAAVTGAAAAVKQLGAALVEVGQKAIVAAMESEDAGNRLRAMLTLRGYGEDVAQEFETVATAIQSTTRFSDEAVIAMQQVALSMGATARDMPTLTAAAADMASAMGTDISEAGRTLAATLNGQVTRELKKLAPELEDLSEAQLRAGMGLDILREKFRGFASQDAESLSGALAGVSTAYGDMLEEIGKAITEDVALKEALIDVADILRAMTPIVVEAVHALGDLVGMAAHAAEELRGVADFLPGVGGALARLGIDLAGGAEGWAAYGRAMREARGSGADDAEGALEIDREMEARIIRDTASRKKRLIEAAVAGNDRGALARMYEQGKIGADEYYGAVDKITGALESQRLKSAQVAAGIQAQRDALSDSVFDAARMVAEIEGLNLSLEDQQALYGTIREELKSNEGAAFSLYREGKIGAHEYAGYLSNLRGEQEALTAKIEGTTVALEAQSARIRANQQEAAASGMDSDWEANAGDVEDTTAEVNEQARASIEEEIAFRQELQALRQQMIDDGAIEVEIQDVLTEATLRHAAAQGDLVAKQQIQIQANEKQRAAFNTTVATMRLMGQAGAQLASGLMQMAITGEGSIKKLVGATLAGIAAEASGKAIMEVAEGFAMSALAAHGDAAAAESAPLHFASAKFYGIVAGVAGAGAIGLGGGGGGGASSAGGSSSDRESFGAFSQSSRQRDAVDAGQQVPSVTLQIIANHPVGDLERFGRQMLPMVQDALSNQGGRTASRRL